MATPSTLIPDLDRRIERAILRCLEPDPQLRPISALMISGSMPGGDPLAEALAAGETPSPEMIAAAGPIEGLQPRGALSLVALVAVCLTTVLLLTPSTTVLGKIPMAVPPEELSIRARDVVRSIGFTEVPASVAAGFSYDVGYLSRTAPTIHGSGGERREQWNRRLAAAPWPIAFNYIQSPGRLDRLPSVSIPALPAGQALLEPGRTITVLDIQGRLLKFARTPSAADLARRSTVEPAWNELFTAAGLDISRFSRSSAAPRLEIADHTLRGPDRTSTRIRHRSGLMHRASTAR